MGNALSIATLHSSVSTYLESWLVKTASWLLDSSGTSFLSLQMKCALLTLYQQDVSSSSLHCQSFLVLLSLRQLVWWWEWYIPSFLHIKRIPELGVWILLPGTVDVSRCMSNSRCQITLWYSQSKIWLSRTIWSIDKTILNYSIINSVCVERVIAGMW